MCTFENKIAGGLGQEWAALTTGALGPFSECLERVNRPRDEQRRVCEESGQQGTQEVRLRLITCRGAPSWPGTPEQTGLVSPWSAPRQLTQSKHKVNAAARALKGVAGTMPGESEEVLEFELRRRWQVERWLARGRLAPRDIQKRNSF